MSDPAEIYYMPDGGLELRTSETNEWVVCHNPVDLGGMQ